MTLPHHSWEDDLAAGASVVGGLNLTLLLVCHHMEGVDSGTCPPRRGSYKLSTRSTLGPNPRKRAHLCSPPHQVCPCLPNSWPRTCWTTLRSYTSARRQWRWVQWQPWMTADRSSWQPSSRTSWFSMGEEMSWPRVIGQGPLIPPLGKIHYLAQIRLGLGFDCLGAKSPLCI
jgi:hypothetical protein